MTIHTLQKFYEHPSNDTANNAKTLAAQNNKLWMFTKTGNNYGSIQQIIDGLEAAGSGQAYRYVIGMCIYPYTYNDGGLKMTNKEAYSYMLVEPKEEIIIPVVVEYSLDASTSSIGSSIEKTISFDIRTSLYKDPLHYSVNIGAKYLNTPQDKLVSTVIKYIADPKPTRVYTSIVE